MLIIRRNPLQDFTALVTKRPGQIFVLGTVATTFLESYLIYNLPVTTIAMLGTIAFLVTYFISNYNYQERITPLMWLGTLSIVSSIILFLVFQFYSFIPCRLAAGWLISNRFFILDLLT